MGSRISSNAKRLITSLIDDVVTSYLEKASASPKDNSGNPFVAALLRDFEPLLHRIHGLKTSLGSQLEKIAEVIAQEAWGASNVKRKQNVNVELPQNVFRAIDSIINNLSNSRSLPNYPQERKMILEACGNPSPVKERHTYEFDLELIARKYKHRYFLEMKGPDPNTTEVPGAKRRLMVALAHGFLAGRNENVDCQFAVYYNNKDPKPYNNPKVLYYFDPDGGLLVQDAFWNFLGKSDHTYQELLALFDNYGKKNKKRIWTGFSKLIKISK